MLQISLIGAGCFIPLNSSFSIPVISPPFLGQSDARVIFDPPGKSMDCQIFAQNGGVQLILCVYLWGSALDESLKGWGVITEQCQEQGQLLLLHGQFSGEKTGTGDTIRPYKLTVGKP